MHFFYQITDVKPEGNLCGEVFLTTTSRLLFQSLPAADRRLIVFQKLKERRREKEKTKKKLVMRSCREVIHGFQLDNNSVYMSVLLGVSPKPGAIELGR